MDIFGFWPVLLQGLQATLVITAGAFVVGAVLAVPVSAARRSTVAVLRVVATGYVELLRGVPPLAWMFIVFFGLPDLGVRLEPVQAGVVVLSLVATAYLSEIYRSGLRAVPRGQVEAAAALGLGPLDIYARIMVPQALLTILPLAVAFLIGLLKDSAAASVIGVLDITGYAINENQRSSAGLALFVSCAVLYLLMSIPVGVFGRWLGVHLRRRAARTA